MPNKMRMKPLLSSLGRDAASHPTAAQTADRPQSEESHIPHQRAIVRLAHWRLVSDILMLTLAGVVETLSAPTAEIDNNPSWRIVFAVLVLALLGLRGRYRPTTGQHFLDDARAILTGTAVAAMLITFLRVAFADNPEVAEQAIRSWLFASVYLVAGRGVLVMVTERSNRLADGGAPTLIVGAGRVGHLIARRLLAHPELGLRPVGFLDPEPLEVEHSSGLPVLGSDDRLEQVVRENGIEHAIISFSNAPYDVQLGLSRALQKMRVSVAIVPRLFEGVPDRISLERLGGLPLVTIYPTNPKDWRVSVKYGLDRIAALLAIILVSPVLLVAAVGTAITLGRPILFRQRRVGLDDREFEMLKFRSMRGRPEEHGEADAEWAARVTGAEPRRGNEGRPAETALGSGSRTTRFGGFLRQSSIDELPQLFNVLKGDMSIVGPRPERSSYVEVFKDRVQRYGDRHLVKAGITGWAQVHGLRGDTSLDDRIEWDNYYIENWSPWLDMKILLLTVLALVHIRAD
jgi:exopolysaccharide biosynthesis polyprenyl glycosylphosphotransferase